MSQYYVWTAEELGLDVLEMDKEHQELIAKMNALYEGVEKKFPSQQVQKLIEDLAQYTVRHFADEEAYMERIQFPDLATHKIIHKQLLSQFQGHVEDFKKTQAVKQSFFDFLKIWLTSHIRGIDRKYSAHAHKKAA